MRKTKTAGRGPPLDAQKRILPAGILSFSATLRITLQGTPAATTPVGISCVTTLPAPITESAPIVTPPQIVEFAPIQTLSSSVMGAEVPMP